MLRTLLASLLALSLSACADLPAWPWTVEPASGSSTQSGSRYSFAWRLSGDRAVAPLQVFDDGRRTWLQFAPGQPVPAIFERDATGDRPLSYTVEGPYLVLAGVWPRLVLRGGNLRSMAERLDDTAAGNPVAADTPSPPAIVTPVHGSAASPPTPLPPSGGPSRPDTAATSAVKASAPAPDTTSARILMPAIASDMADPTSSAQMLTAASFELGVKPPTAFEVSPRDATLRGALARWASTAGWTFDAEHWAVDADIPIVGSARFEALFKPAVQQLVAATELADRPLQPCFYSNQVLRIVPYAQSCDRTAGPSGAPS